MNWSLFSWLYLTCSFVPHLSIIHCHDFRARHNNIWTSGVAFASLVKPCAERCEWGSLVSELPSMWVSWTWLLAGWIDKCMENIQMKLWQLIVNVPVIVVIRSCIPYYLTFCCMPLQAWVTRVLGFTGRCMQLKSNLNWDTIFLLQVVFFNHETANTEQEGFISLTPFIVLG